MCYRRISPANWYIRSLLCRVTGPVREEALEVGGEGVDGVVDVESFECLP